MKKLMSLVIAAAVGVSMIGCAEQKTGTPVTPPANTPVEPANNENKATENTGPSTPAPEGGTNPAPEGKAP